jgi:flagellar motility protein MotE (MotC chaperone)
MKKILIVAQILIVGMVIVKLLAAGQLFFDKDVHKKDLSFVGQAMAQLTTSGNSPEKLKDIFDDKLQKERDLYGALEKRKTELDARENAMRTEAQNLQVLKKEITDKIDALKALEKQLDGKLDTQNAVDIKKYKDLAKIYESAAPAKAGAMMEKLDIKTAAGITMSMKKDRAGAVLSNMNLQKAVEITKEITQLTKVTQDAKP